MNNIFYFKIISKIGGTEQFLYEIAKKYNNLDITIFYDEADLFQLERLRKYIRCKKRIPGEKIQCKKAFYNFNIDMIEDVEAKEQIFVAHAIYQELGYKPPINHPKLTKIIGVSQYSVDKIEEFAKILGLELKVEKCYNPFTLEPKEKVLHLLSATRLDDETKGKERTYELIRALDRYSEETGRHYVWTFFTNTELEIESKNITCMKPRVDVRTYIADSDYIIQLSNDMETYCYTINEALGYGVPIVTTPLSILKELPVDDNMRIELNFDCSNVDEVARQIFEKKVEPFEYTPPLDGWGKLLLKGKSTYSPDLNFKTKVTVECIKPYDDNELKRFITKEDAPYEVFLNRAEYLVENNLVRIVKK